MLNTYDSELSDESGNDFRRLGNAIVTIVLSRKAMDTPSIAIRSTVRGATVRRRESGIEAGDPTRSRLTLSVAYAAEMPGMGNRRGTPTFAARPRTALHPSVADWMTIAHGLCGYVAVALLAGRWQSHPRSGGVTIGDLRVVAALVADGSVLDLADGPVARRFGSSGMGE